MGKKLLFDGIYYNKVSKTGWFEQHKYIFPGFEVQAGKINVLASKELYFPSAHMIITKCVHMSSDPDFLKEYLLYCSGVHFEDLLTDLHL